MDQRPLSHLRPGERGRIIRVRGDARFRRRIMEMGMVPGEVVEVVRLAPLGDPVQFRVKGYRLALRTREAAHILVEPLNGAR